MSPFATLRALFGFPDGGAISHDPRSPSHIQSAATRKAKQRALQDATTAAIRDHCQRKGLLPRA